MGNFGEGGTQTKLTEFYSGRQRPGAKKKRVGAQRANAQVVDDSTDDIAFPSFENLVVHGKATNGPPAQSRSYARPTDAAAAAGSAATGVGGRAGAPSGATKRVRWRAATAADMQSTKGSAAEPAAAAYVPSSRSAHVVIPAAAAAAAGAANAAGIPLSDVSYDGIRRSEVVHRHIKEAADVRAFQLPAAHVFLVEQNPNMRALYFFIRKLATVEPNNPTRKTATPQYQTERMWSMWVTTPDTLEFKQSKLIADKYKTDMIEAEGKPDGPEKVNTRFATHFDSYLAYFISPAVGTAMRNVMIQIRKTPRTDLIRFRVSLAKLMLHDSLTDIFVHLVNARLHIPSDPTSFRGLSDKSADTLNETYQRYLDDIVNAKCHVRGNLEIWTI